jgi:tight adherence protein C
MGLIILTFSAIFLLIASVGLLMFYREAMLARITAVINPGLKPKKTLLGSIQRTGVSLGGMVERLEGVLPKSQAEVSVVQQRLIRAGYRSDSATKIFYGVKILFPVILCLLVAAGRSSSFFLYIAALGLGFLLPDFGLGKLIAKRQKRIRLGLPDALDMLVICVEAGLGVDQATARTAQELRSAQPAISDELGIVVLEQHAGRARSDAWKNFAERSDVDSVRNLVTILIQSEQFGTSIAKTLRVHSDTLRSQRRQKVEEQAAKTTIKLIFPLVFFIFPSLFLVTLGPAIIIITHSFTVLNK